MVRTAIYLRISQDKTGEAAGVTRQREDCEALARDLGWHVADVYVDNSVEATSGRPRPEYLRMLADIKADRIDAIVAWHPDRLYRRLADLEELIEVVERHHVAIRTCRAGEIDLSTPTGRMIARILGSVATHEVEHKVERWYRSVRQRREAGRWNAAGPRTFGYERDGTVRPDEAEAIRRAAKDLLAGVGIGDVCRKLNAEGWRTTRGGPWTQTALKVLLTSPRVAGLSSLRGEILGPGDWEPILDRPTWERLRATFDARRRDTSRSKRRSPWPRQLLTGIVVCGYPVDGRECGNPLTRSGTVYGPRYQCRTGSLPNGHVTVAGRALEEMVERYARRRLADERVRAYLAAEATSTDRAATIAREIAELEAEIAELEAELERAGRRARAAALRAIDSLDNQLEAKRAALARVAPVALPEGDVWPEDVTRRALLIRLVVDRVVVYPKTRHLPYLDPERVRIVPRVLES